LNKDQEYGNVLKACEYVTLSKDLTQSCYIHKFTVVEDKLTMQGNSSLKKQPQLTGDSPSFPLSHGQQAMWFLYQMAPQSIAYNIYTTVRIGSELDLGAWHRAWLRIVERHQALRTTYTKRDGQPVQVVHLYQEVDVKVTDASSWSDDYLKKQILAEAECPYNLETGPVLRVHLFTRSAVEHIQLLAMHHIAGDMWSFDILLSELRVLYAAEVKTLPPSSIHVVENSDISNSQRDNILPLPTLSYTDYVRWQTEMLASSKGEQLSAYWQKQLAGELPLLDLPMDKPRPREQTYCGASHIIELDKELLQKLRQLSEAEETSLYRILLAAFFVLLYRYTGQEDILVGSPMAGRSARKPFKEIVGYFTDPVVCRANLSGNPTFQEFLDQVHRTVFGALRHQDYPFPLLVKQLAPQRDTSRSPLFQVLFTWQKHRWYDKAQKSPLSQGKKLLVMEPYPIEGLQRGAAFDLDLAVVEAGSSLQFCWQYNTDLFDASTVHRMAGSYQTLLEGILTNPEDRVSALPLLTQAERHQLLVEWNDTKVEYPFDKCIHQLFEEQVELTPDAEAVLFEDKQLTYRELNQRANCLAHHLRTLGVGPEVLVGICVERSLEMVVGLLGILKAGGAYVPLDPSYPSERLAFMLEDSSVSVLLTQASLVEALPKHQARVLCLDTDALSFAMQTKSNPISGVMPKNLAYVIYTSGSTGKPKGAMNTHRAICNRLLWMQDTYQLTEADRVLQKTPFSFDVSVWEFFWPLLTGARLVIAKQDGHRDPGYLVKAIVQQQITTLHFVPSMLQIFLEEQGLESCSCLRRVICSGEALPKELVERFFVRLECELHNLYGPTEAAIDVTFWQCKRDSNLKTVPIGRPIANTQLYILDRYLQPVPVGVAGELYIGGDGVARGYLNRPELTNEKFISHHAQMRLYKTGDKARYLPDGNIEYLGRFDNQVKIRGFRIELGEIEAAIAQHTAVRETVVIAREDVPDQKYLAAYIVPNHSYAIASSELRGFLKQKLPDYMIPGVFVVLDALPLTPNGKVDRRALPAPEFQPELQQSLLAPRTPIEEMLTSIWADVLRIELVGVHQNFFELGGHSLLATQVISRVRDTLAVELPLRSLFEAPTIAELASRVELELKNGQSQEAEPLLPIPRLESIPLSFAQARLWFLDQLQPNSAFYNIPLALRLSGQLNIAAIESSINEIIQRHEALRTNFTTQEGQPVQIIASTLNLKLLVVDLLYLPESSREIEAQRLAFEEANRPFNLEREPLVRGTALQLGETEYILVLTMHHIISDGWSLGVFVRELTELYKAFCTGSPPVLPLLPVQYADFAVWQRQWLSGEVLKTQLDYWKEQLKNAPNLLELPTDRPRKAIQTFQGGYYSAAFDKESERRTYCSEQAIGSHSVYDAGSSVSDITVPLIR
jgi:amino acid adenylation domain-containing protein